MYENIGKKRKTTPSMRYVFIREHDSMYTYVPSSSQIYTLRKHHKKIKKQPLIQLDSAVYTEKLSPSVG